LVYLWVEAGRGVGGVIVFGGSLLFFLGHLYEILQLLSKSSAQAQSNTALIEQIG